MTPHIDAAETIKSWIAGFDAIIDDAAADPAAVKADRFLRRIFLLAFPPSGLPDEIVFTSKGDAPNWEALKQAHAPYYSGPERTWLKVDPETGGGGPVSSKLELRLKNLSGVDAVLRKNGLLRRSFRPPSTPSGKRRGRVATEVGQLLKIRDDSRLEIENLRKLEQQARREGDLRAAAVFEANQKRVAELLERILGQGDLL